MIHQHTHDHRVHVAPQSSVHGHGPENEACHKRNTPGEDETGPLNLSWRAGAAAIHSLRSPGPGLAGIAHVPAVQVHASVPSITRRGDQTLADHPVGCIGYQTSPQFHWGAGSGVAHHDGLDGEWQPKIASRGYRKSRHSIRVAIGTMGAFITPGHSLLLCHQSTPARVVDHSPGMTYIMGHPSRQTRRAVCFCFASVPSRGALLTHRGTTLGSKSTKLAL
mmetsp:Transcript_101954/g.233503  ORF Transcript_101954/g.233503 Transcript_101954/m.233503 type:complete len:221 (+) Transcript_101954:2391-3053(+)